MTIIAALALVFGAEQVAAQAQEKERLLAGVLMLAASDVPVSEKDIEQALQISLEEYKKTAPTSALPFHLWESNAPVARIRLQQSRLSPIGGKDPLLPNVQMVTINVKPDYCITADDIKNASGVNYSESWRPNPHGKPGAIWSGYAFIMTTDVTRMHKTLVVAPLCATEFRIGKSFR